MTRGRPPTTSDKKQPRSRSCCIVRQNEWLLRPLGTLNLFHSILTDAMSNPAFHLEQLKQGKRRGSETVAAVSYTDT